MICGNRTKAGVEMQRLQTAETPQPVGDRVQGGRLPLSAKRCTTTPLSDTTREELVFQQLRTSEAMTGDHGNNFGMSTVGGHEN